MPDDPRPLIVTALLDRTSMARFEALRRSHYPPERNQVSAHVTLFRQLPGRELDAVRRQIKAIARVTPPLAADVLPPRANGNGVAFPLVAPELVMVHAELADGWASLLIASDRAQLHPHVTVQNKVRATLARATLDVLERDFVPWRAQVTSIALWRYLDGPWESLGEIRLRGA
jgi:2'-5' RNA ligase